MSADADGLALYRRLFEYRSAGAPGRRASVDRASLPSPLAYLAQQGLLTTRPRGEWASIRCPVHKAGGEAHPSLRVSLVDGHFRCHACGASGGDVIALHRLVSGLRFRDAVWDLGGRFHD